MGKIGVMGERDSVLLYKAVGFDVFFETDAAKASRTLHSLARQGYHVIFLTEKLYKECTEAVSAYREEPFPVIVPIPDNQGSRGVGMAELKANVERAVGADILFS